MPGKNDATQELVSRFRSEGVSVREGSTYADLNARVIDAWVEDGWEWGTPISHERYAAALAGDWSMVLTPTREVPCSWFFPDMAGPSSLRWARR